MTYTKWIALLTLFNDIIKMVALLTIITTNDGISKMDSAANLFRWRIQEVRTTNTSTKVINMIRLIY